MTINLFRISGTVSDVKSRSVDGETEVEEGEKGK